MDWIVLLVAGLLIAVVAFAVYRKFQRDSAEFDRRFDFSEDGIMERANNKPIRFQGVGAQTTRPFRLESGDYKVRYRFPEGVMVKVELLSADGVSEETLVLKAGAGEAAFSADAGRYLLDIDPQDEDVAWKLEITRLGLPSGYKPPLT
jgi:hypothetical protein